MTNIFIDGCAGGIGSSFGYYLFKKGYKIIGVDNLHNGYKENLEIDKKKWCKFYNADIRDAERMSFILKKEKIDAIIHMAAISSLPECQSNPIECFSVNTQGTINLLEAARQNKIKKFVMASTSAVYENNTRFPHFIPFSEKEMVCPTLAYSLSKKLAEDVCMSYIENYGINIAILRYFNVFGPKQDIHRPMPPLINSIVKEIKNGRQPTLHSTGEQKRDYVHISDVCNATEKAMLSDKTGIYNVSSEKCHSVNDIYEIIAKHLNFNKPAIFKPAENLWDSYKTGLSPDIISKETNKMSVGYNNKIRDELGVNIRDRFEDLLKETVDEIVKLYF